jgi:predicted transcriptional regulator
LARYLISDLARWRMNDLGLTQAEAAKALGCSSAMVSRMLSGTVAPALLVERAAVVVFRMPLDLITEERE